VRRLEGVTTSGLGLIGLIGLILGLTGLPARLA
jgi:hypothetical protein